MEISEEELMEKLVDAGNKLISPPSLVSELLESLNLFESLLLDVEQSPSESMREALAPSTKALIAEELLRHSDADVKVAVASCISEITRITAPEAPYADDEMKEVFQLTVSCFEKLDDDKSSPSYIKRISILETLARVRSCVMMLDLECDDLVVEMFKHFFRTIRDDHHVGVFSAMETIMTLVLEESESISVDLLSSILNVLKKEDKEVLPIARLLGEKVIISCASQVKPYLLSAVRSRGASLDDYTKAVADIWQPGGEAVKPTDDVTNENPGNVNNSEKAVEVAMETMEDAPPSEEIAPSTVGSPKTVMSNCVLKKGSEDIPATNSNSNEADNNTQDEEAEPSEAKVESVADEETPKSEQPKSNGQQGKKSNSTNSSESREPILSDTKNEVTDMPEHHENDAKDVDDIACEDPAIDTIAAAHNEKLLEEPIVSAIASDNAHDLSPPSTTGSLVDETLPEQLGLERKKEHPIQENESVSDLDCKMESDSQQDSEHLALDKKKEHPIQEKNSVSDLNCRKESDIQQDSEQLVLEKKKEHPIQENESVGDLDCKKESDGQEDSELHGLEKKKEHPIQVNESVSDPDCRKESDRQEDSEQATGCTLNKHAGKPSASDQEEKLADSANDTMKKGDNINELDGDSAKEVTQEAEIGGSPRVNKKKRGQRKATPAKGYSKTPAKDDKKKALAIPKLTPNKTKDGSGIEKASKSSSKRKHSSNEKALQTNVNDQDLVGAKIEVWWPDDRKFYKGVIKSFDAAEKKHKILYYDNEIELLNLKNEKWKFVGEQEGHGSDGESPDESADKTPKGKKAKTSADLEATQGNTLSSTKISGASSSKTKSAPKSAKTKEEASNKISKSVSKASKSGNKLSDSASKSAKKYKDDEDSPKGSVKSKQGTSAKSKGKSPKSVGKSSANTSGKVKVSTSSADEDSEDESPEPEKSKWKSQSTKSQSNSNKRKRSMKVR